MSSISTHILDTSIGRPASGVPVVLDRRGRDGRWEKVGAAETNVDGRVEKLMRSRGGASPGVYRLVFDTKHYFDREHIRTFYPTVIVMFEITDEDAHYHVPLLLSPFGYSTYRGS